jgi:beta-glucosidase
VEVAGPARDTVSARVQLANTGPRPADETVQLYVRPLSPAMRMPLLALRDFRRVRIEPGTTTEVVFDLSAAAFSWVNPSGDRAFVPGRYEILAAPCAPSAGGPWPVSAPARAEVVLGA